MKILYVEDELVTNIDRIERLFEKYLDEDVSEKLKAFKEKRLKKPDELKKIVEETNLIEIVYRFPDALCKIIHDHEKYSLFIIDRNLSRGRYEHEEVRKIDRTYNEEKYEKFSKSNREGDYLLHQLILIHKLDVKEKFFFLTAYSAKDELRGAEDIKNYIVMKQFEERNFIEKGKEEDFERLKKIVDNHEVINLIHENMAYLRTLNDNIGEKSAETFLHILNKKDSGKSEEIAENLGSIRTIFDNILKGIAERLNAPANCWNKKNPDQIVMRAVIGWIADFTYDEETKRKNWNYRFESNSLIKNFLFDIQEIASDFGSHKDLTPKPSGYQPTPDTVNALVYALKDVITWFGKICSRYSKTGS